MKRTISTILALITLLSLLTIIAPYAAAEDSVVSAIDNAVTFNEITDEDTLYQEDVVVPEGYDLEAQDDEEANEDSAPLFKEDTELAETRNRRQLFR